MPPSLRIEAQGADPDEWIHVGSVNLGDRDGTLSDNHEYGRDIYLFGVDPIENEGYVKKSVLGVDVEIGGTVIRSIGAARFITVAALRDGESHELTVQTDKSPEPRTLRFTYLEE